MQNKSILFKLLCVLFGLIPIVLATSCVSDSDKEDELPGRTVLVYMAADNNLCDMVEPNLAAMLKSTIGIPEQYHLVAFVDKLNEHPCMLYLHDNSIDTLRVYGELQSSDSRTLADAIEYIRTEWQSDTYGLILWSHGTGWIPTYMLHSVAQNLGYAPGRDMQSSVSEDMLGGYLSGEKAETRSFVIENRNYGNPWYTAMEIKDLADAIPDGMFDFIAFDACYMGCVEVLYELRNKARYIISSPCEIISQGFPYITATRNLMLGNLTSACRDFYNFYNSESSWRMGAISLVRTEGLEDLARCFGRVAACRTAPINKSQVRQIQRYDRFNFYGSENRVFYDLADVAGFLCDDPDLLDEFNSQLKRCVLYASSTPYMFPGYSYGFPIQDFSGLSVFIPLHEYNLNGLNYEYAKLDWSRDADYFNKEN